MRVFDIADDVDCDDAVAAVVADVKILQNDSFDSSDLHGSSY